MSAPKYRPRVASRLPRALGGNSACELSSVLFPDKGAILSAYYNNINLCRLSVLQDARKPNDVS